MKKSQNPIEFWKEETVFQLQGCESENEVHALVADIRKKAIASVTTRINDAITDTVNEFLGDDYYTVFRAGFTSATYKRFDLEAAKAYANDIYELYGYDEDVWIDTIYGDTVYELLGIVSDADDDTDERVIEVDDLT